MREVTEGKARPRRWGRREEENEEEEEERGWPQGERRERSRWVTERKQVGTMMRSRRLPRRERWDRVERSRRSHLWLTREAALRVRVSER